MFLKGIKTEITDTSREKTRRLFPRSEGRHKFPVRPHQVPRMLTEKRSTPRHILAKFQSSTKKEKILKLLMLSTKEPVTLKSKCC